MEPLDADELIRRLDLQPHPEGGYYRETYRASTRTQTVEREGHLVRLENPRSVSTAIYFLLPAGEKSTWHRIDADEMWHFYAGGPMLIAELHEQGRVRETILGSDLAAGQKPQHVVPAGCWFASRPLAEDGYSFVGCTVAPGFEFDHFELANTQALLDDWPQNRELIDSLAR